MARLGPGDVAYYIDEHADEIMPCDATLEGWAEWLSKPDPTWPHDIPKDGDKFAASALRFAEDIVATRHAGGEWIFSRDLTDEPSLLAVRFGMGLGWDPDNIIYPCTLDALREFFADPINSADDEEYIAVAYDEQPMTLIYKAHPPRLIVKDRVDP